MSRAAAVRSLVLLAAITLAAPSLGAERLIDRYPWLNDRSVWRQDVDLRKTPAPPRESLGCFGIGNGLVFAHEGLSIPANRLEGLIGPTHALPAGGAAFGETIVRLRRGGAEVEFPVQETMRTRRAPIVITKAGLPGDVELFTVDFAPPGKAAILRVLFVLNVGATPLRDAELRVEMPSARADGGRLRQESGGARLVAGLAPGGFGGATALDGALQVSVPEVAPGGEAHVLLYLATSASIDEESALVEAIEKRGMDLLGDTRRHWDAWFRTLLDLETPDPRIDDFVDDTLVSIEIQRSAATGAFAPLVFSRDASLRDASGPVLALLEAGAHEEVRRWLEHAGRASVRLGRLPDAIPPDVDSSVPASPGAVDFETFPVPRAEVPSWFILQHAWYWRASGDASSAVAWYPLLRRAFLGQEVRADGTMPFHGGEPYLRECPVALFPDRVGWPNEFIAFDPAAGIDGASLDSAMLFVAAAEPMRRAADAAERPTNETREFSAAAQKVRRAIEDLHFIGDARPGDRSGRYAPALSALTGEPHEAHMAPVSLRPILVGFQTIANRRMVSHLDSTIAELYDASTGRWRLTSSCAFTCDAVAGAGLANLAALDDPDCPRAMAGLLDSASPSGDFAWLHGPDGRPAAEPRPGRDRRLLPSRAGLELHGLLSYLVGRRGRDGTIVEIAPRLLPSWKRVEYRNVRVGDAAIDVLVEREPGAMIHSFRNKGGSLVEVTARLLFDGANPTAAEVNGKPFRVSDLGVQARPGGSCVGTFAAQIAGGSVITLRVELQPSTRTSEPLGAIPYAPRPIDTKRAREIVLTAATTTESAPGRLVIDVGLPLRPETIAGTIVDAATGRRRVDRLVIAAGARESGPRTYKTAEFWSSPVLGAALERFAAEGGTVADMTFQGREIHGRFADGGWRFAILPGTSREKSPAEIEGALSIDGIDALIRSIASIPSGENVTFRAWGDPPEDELRRAREAAREAAAKAGLRPDF